MNTKIIEGFDDDDDNAKVTTAVAGTTGVVVVVVLVVVAVEVAAIPLWFVFFSHYFKYCESE